MITVQDQIGNRFVFEKSPARIISIVPSQSEFLWDLGMKDQLVGITKFCVHPDEMFRSVTRVGGTKKLDIKMIRSLKPDLIIGNKEENERGEIELLQKEFPVWMSDIFSFDDACQMMNSLGLIFGKETASLAITNRIKNAIAEVKNIFSGQTTAYFIWNDPYMFAAKNTFIDHVLIHIGLENALKDFSRYPQLNKEELTKLNPDYCFLSSEPFPFKAKHVEELKKILPQSKIIVVDGEMFSWYGTRLIELNRYVKNLLLKTAAV
jgi:ABC-type Fe3+-hydroxamate transport system substrate-binding protein